ncbi:MAG: hypothetical protein GX962_13030 [Epulopiscium sp.]|nr:hypothetical protein [Candidatus Epulonipiscium sp.]
MNVLAEGLMITIIGMGITLLSLLLLSYILDLFGYLSKGKPKTEAAVEEVVVTDVEESEEEIDDLELIAVISAAIAASLETTTDQLQIRSFKRVGNPNSNWNRINR